MTSKQKQMLKNRMLLAIAQNRKHCKWCGEGDFSVRKIRIIWYAKGNNAQHITDIGEFLLSDMFWADGRFSTYVINWMDGCKNDRDGTHYEIEIL